MHRTKLTIRTFMLVTGLALSLAFAVSMAGNAEDTREYVPDEILITYEENVSDQSIEKVAQRKDGEVTKTVDLSEDQTMAVVELPEDQSVTEAVASYEKDGKILSAQPNYIYSTQVAKQSLSEGYSTGTLWYLDKLNLYSAWYLMQNANLTGRKKVKVAVLDTGIDTTHADLVAGQIDTDDSARLSFSIFGNRVEAYDMDGDWVGHGTNVSGIIGATPNNRIGIRGAATGKISGTTQNDMMEIVGVNVFTYLYRGEYETTTDLLIEGFQYVKDQVPDVSIINMSLGGSYNDPYLKLKVDQMKSAGYTMICASGNESASSVCYPGAYSSTISVASSNQSGKKSSFSNYGSALDLTAPGEGIVTTARGSGYASVSGTSISTPLVTGIVAMVKYILPSATPDQVKNILRTTTNDLYTAGKDKYSGYGMANAYNAVENALQQANLSSKKTVSGITTKSAGAGKVKISWSKLAGASGYVICQATKKNGTYKAIKTLTSGSTTSYTKSGLAGGKEYYYKVCAYYGNTSIRSNYSHAKTGVTGKGYSLTGKSKTKVTLMSGAESGAKKVKGISRGKQVTITRFAISQNGILWARVKVKAGKKYYYGYVRGSKLSYSGSEKLYKKGAIRKSITNSSKKITTVSKKKKVTITGVKLAKDGVIWYKVKYTKGKKNFKGYISQSYLK